MKKLSELFRKSNGEDQTVDFGGEGMSEGGDVSQPEKNKKSKKKIRIKIKTC